MVLPAYIDESTGEITDGEAWVGIATTTLGADAATVTFTSTNDGQVGDWSQYMDLVLVTYSRGETVGLTDGNKVRFNNDTTGANYQAQRLDADGSGAYAGTYDTSGVWISAPGTSAGANEFGASVQHIFDINSGKYKSVVGSEAQDSNGDGTVAIRATTWRSVAAITEIDIVAGTGDLLAGSMFSLFGVLPRMVA